jgi:hypothetical protein
MADAAQGENSMARANRQTAMKYSSTTEEVTKSRSVENCGETAAEDPDWSEQEGKQGLIFRLAWLSGKVGDAVVFAVRERFRADEKETIILVAAELRNIRIGQRDPGKRQQHDQNQQSGRVAPRPLALVTDLAKEPVTPLNAVRPFDAIG